MSLDNRELLQFVVALAEEEDIKVCVYGSLKGGLIVGSCASVGGVLLGPLGLAVGAIAGGIYASVKSQGQFRPAAEIIMNLSPEKQDKLIRHLQETFANVGVNDILILLMFLKSNPDYKQILIDATKRYLEQM